MAHLQAMNRQIVRGKPAVCNYCDGSVFFLKTAAGRFMPCDTTSVTGITAEGTTCIGYPPHFGSCSGRAETAEHEGEKILPAGGKLVSVLLSSGIIVKVVPQGAGA